MRVLMWIVVGIVSGWLAGAIMRVDNNSLVQNLLIGTVGSVVGGCCMSVLGFYAYGLFANIIVSVLGACLFLYLAKKITNNRR